MDSAIRWINLYPVDSAIGFGIFHSHKMHMLGFVWAILQIENIKYRQIFLPIHILQLVKSLLFHIPQTYM